jgi:4'-phosphopantetheinyl transferase
MNPTSVAPAGSLWSSPPDTLAIGCDEIHVWRASLDQAPLQVESFLLSFAADEKARAERFYFARDRGHFIVARGVLRAILGRYMNRAPEQLSFRYGAQGKPVIAGESGVDAIHFNLSHSHGLALYAITRGRQVGIDLERIRSDVATAEIAGRFFPPGEAATLQALPADMQRQAFFRSWTRKEASIKARGEGLFSLNQFELQPDSGESDAMGSHRDPIEAARWSLQEFFPAPDYVAALAAEGHGWRVSCWQWPE